MKTKFLTHLSPLILFSSALSGAEFYVSPQGADSGDGTKEQPFNMIEKARDAVAQLKAAKPDEPVTVWIKSGGYLTREGVSFSKKDSGTEAGPVIYRAMAGEEPVFSSGVMVSPDALKPVTDKAVLARVHPAAQGKIMQIDLAAMGIKPTPFADNFHKLAMLDIYFDGKRPPLARWPNGNTFATMEKVTDNGLNPPHGGTFVYRGEEPTRWTQALKEEGVWLRGFWRVPWVIEVARVGKIDPENKTITFAAVISGGIGSKYARDKKGIGPGDGKEAWHVLNLLEEIDQPGEWCVNFKTNTLYIWPPSEVKEGSLLVSDRKTPVFSFDQTSYVTLRGLTVDGGLGNGIGIAGGDHVTVAGCTVREMGDCGVFITGGHDHTVVSCDIYETGQEGISFIGGERKTLTSGNHKIINNHIRNVALFFPVAAITAGDKTKSETVGNLVAHNRIHDVPNSGIVFSGNENVFEYNEIYRVGLGSGDLGCFYTTGGWTARGNIVRYNFVHHSMNANALYVDDGDCGDTFFGNVDYKTASGGFIGGGHDQTFKNNIFIECTHAMHVDSRGISRHYNAQDKRLTDDLNSVPYQSPPWSEKYPSLVHILENKPDVPSGIVIEKNLIISCEAALRKSGNETDFAGVSFKDNAETKDMSVFVDPENFNFAIKPDAQVPAPGFEPIPFEKIGLVEDEYRTKVPERDMQLLRTGKTERHFDSQTDIDASNR